MLTFLSVLAFSLSAFAQVDHPQKIFQDMTENKYENCFINTNHNVYNQLYLNGKFFAGSFEKSEM